MKDYISQVVIASVLARMVSLTCVPYYQTLALHMWYARLSPGLLNIMSWSALYMFTLRVYVYVWHGRHKPKPAWYNARNCKWKKYQSSRHRTSILRGLSQSLCTQTTWLLQCTTMQAQVSRISIDNVMRTLQAHVFPGTFLYI